MKNIKNGAKHEKEKKSVSVPAEKIRSKDTEENGLPFKKVLYGYDPDEVASYIGEMNHTAEASAKNYELKLSSIKEELVLSNRERDFYAEKYRASKDSSAKEPLKPAESRDDEYEAIIARYKTELEQAKEEIARHGVEGGENANAVKELSKENEALNKKAEILSRENGELSVKAQKYDELLADYGAVVAQLEQLKAEREGKEAMLAEASAELEGRLAEIQKISEENENSKKRLAELEAENGVLTQRAEEKEKEILRLKELNKTQAYESAERISVLENECAAGRLAMQKEQKLHAYHIGQAELTLAELAKQIEQIKQSFAD